ncbi:MAG: hypothetical protein V3T22_07605 [Planctomycetota bacterium]
MIFELPFLAPLVCALVLTPLLARVAVARGWVDGRTGALAARKPRRAPVPPVGGVVLFVALVVGRIAGGDELPWLTMSLALALGLADDLRRGGLSAGWKFAGQGLVAAALAWETPGGPGSRALAAFVALVAQNAVNTWDNADGAAGGLGLVALAPLAPAAGALVGFLPWNLMRRERAGERVPSAYLGDAGSHLVGVLVASTPEAWPFLVLPLADLARLCVLRVSRGRAPWSADRLHLAHRLAAAGLAPLPIALGLAALVALPWATTCLWPGPGGTALGVTATLVGFLLLMVFTPELGDPVAGLGPCSPTSAGR